MKFGLTDSDLEYIRVQLEKHPQIDKALIFGSRAKGNYKAGSDIDLAICGEQVNFHVVSMLHASLEDEGPLPYLIDVVDYTHLGHEELRAHIDRVGIVIYEKLCIE